MSYEDKKQMTRRIQLATLNSLKKLDEICKKYDIKYWACYGTLLGAIRHKGFIPWDDDLDIGMMHDDFKRLCEVPKEEWGDECVLMSGYSQDERHDKLFGRIYQDKSRIQSPRDILQWKNPKTGKAFYTSLMCDIYIFDYVPDDDKEFSRTCSKTLKIATSEYKLSKLKSVPQKGLKNHLRSVKRNLIGGALRLFHSDAPSYLSRKCEDIIDGASKGKRIGTYYTIDNYLYDRDDYFPLQETEFEGMKIMIPKNYEKVLTDMYGDYMTFPPEAERYHINFIYADLGNGEKYIVDPMKGSLGEGMKPNYKEE